MALFHIQRMRPAPEGQVTVDCVAGQEAREILIIDQDTKLTQTVQMCWDPNVPVCDNLNLLEGTFTPNDWHAECHP